VSARVSRDRPDTTQHPPSRICELSGDARKCRAASDPLNHERRVEDDEKAFEVNRRNVGRWRDQCFEPSRVSCPFVVVDVGGPDCSEFVFEMGGGLSWKSEGKEKKMREKGQAGRLALKRQASTREREKSKRVTWNGRVGTKKGLFDVREWMGRRGKGGRKGAGKETRTRGQQ
jgi:hypothetical protein